MTRWSLAVLTAALVACGGGSRGSNTEPGPPVDGGAGVTLSGTIVAAATAVADGDTADPGQTTSNDTPDRAQQVTQAATIGGHVGPKGVDDVDLYRATLAAGQVIALDVVRDDEDVLSGTLRLCVYAASDVATPVACVGSVTTSRTLAVTASGDHLIEVSAEQGSTNYVLRLSRSTEANAPPLRLDAVFVPGDVVVRFKPTLLPMDTRQTLDAQARSIGLSIKAGVPGGGPVLLTWGDEAQRARAFAALAIQPAAGPRDAVLAAKEETLQVVHALRQRADIESADPNYIRRAFAEPTDPQYRLQWHYPLIQLPQAWDITTGTPVTGDDVVVAVLDTGVLVAHPDLAPKLVPGYDFISDIESANDGNGPDANADDPGDEARRSSSSWHGTHVAGTIGASANDDGVAGVAWGAKIMPLRVLGRSGGTSFDIIQALRFAAGLNNASGTVPARRADILNLSLGGPNASASEAAEYAAARARGVIIVAAAGNENSGESMFPASYDGVVSVSAVDLEARRAPYSNFGPAVDVAAPGGNSGADLDGNGIPDGVVSTYVDETGGGRAAAVGQLNGTSMASPHVAGVAALMKAVCPALSPDGFDTLLSSGQLTRDIGDPGRDDLYGHGLIDALAAVQAAQGACGTAATPSLRVSPTRLDVEPSASVATFTVDAAGPGLGVASLSANVPWIQITARPTSASGLGTYAITVDRTALPGTATGRITITSTDQKTVVLPVTVQLASTGTRGDAGRLYVLLLDKRLDVIDQVAVSATNGEYRFTFAEVPTGTYYVVAGSDSDNDGRICDAGEACGSYPTLGVLGEVRATRSRDDLAFIVAYTPEIGTQDAAPRASMSFERARAPKAYGGTR